MRHSIHAKSFCAAVCVRGDFFWKTSRGTVFTREVTFDVPVPVTVQAEANCNMHGSREPSTLRIDPSVKVP